MLLKKENVVTSVSSSAFGNGRVEEQRMRTEIIRTGWDMTHSFSGLP